MFYSFIMFQGLFFFNYTFLISNIFSNELSDIFNSECALCQARGCFKPN